MRVLILHPDLAKLGGIESYYTKLLKHFQIDVESFPVGRRPGERGGIFSVWRLLADYWKFQRRIGRGDIDVVHVNPSFSFRGFLREGWFVFLAKRRGLRTLIFVRGWQSNFEAFACGRGRSVCRWIVRHADGMIVLARVFEDTLRSIGYRGTVWREVTVVDDGDIAEFDLEAALDARLSAPVLRAVFVSRITQPKGIYLAMEAVQHARRDGTPIELLVVGDGEELSPAQDWVDKQGLEGITFAGRLNREEVATALKDSALFFFPTLHGEGLPNAVVEAMAFGLPVITRPVGGVADFFVPGEHGYLSESEDPRVFAEFLTKIVGENELYRAISRNNADYAREHFLASRAAARLEGIYRELLS